MKSSSFPTKRVSVYVRSRYALHIFWRDVLLQNFGECSASPSKVTTQEHGRDRVIYGGGNTAERVRGEMFRVTLST